MLPILHRGGVSSGTAALYMCKRREFHSTRLNGYWSDSCGWGYLVISAYGPAIVTIPKFQNRVAFWCDTTYSSGGAGFALYNGSATLSEFSQISSWRGYSAVQQDGIWQKQGSINIPLVATDINTGSSDVNSGIDSASVILQEGNAQILSGTVYKIWFGTASGIQYAESTDAINWSRYGSTVIAGFSFPEVIKVGSTYYMYCQSNTVTAGTGNINLYTSTDGINWSSQSSTILALGAGGAWDNDSIYIFCPVTQIAGTWYALYTGVNSSNTPAFAMGVATSSDLINWTKYAGNPVITGVVSGPPYFINGKWWLWAEQVPPGQESPAYDPTTGQRLYSLDLLNWVVNTSSIQHSQLVEGVNSVKGFSYPTSLLTVGGKTYMFLESGPSNTASNTGSSWNLSLAIAPAPMSSIILFPESADSQVVSDAFTSGTGNLSSNWTTPTGGTALQIVAGPYVEPTVTSTLCQAVYTGASFSPNHYSEVMLKTLTGTLFQSFIQPTVRASLTALTAYEGVIGSPSGTKDAAAQIVKRVAGSSTQIGPTATITPQVGDVWRLSVVTGSDGFPTLSLFQNGVLILQVQDQSSTPITTGNPGMQAYSSVADGDAQISAWAGGNANVIPAYPSGASSSWLTVALINSLRGLKH